MPFLVVYYSSPLRRYKWCFQKRDQFHIGVQCAFNKISPCTGSLHEASHIQLSLRVKYFSEIIYKNKYIIPIQWSLSLTCSTYLMHSMHCPRKKLMINHGSKGRIYKIEVNISILYNIQMMCLLRLIQKPFEDPDVHNMQPRLVRKSPSTADDKSYTYKCVQTLVSTLATLPRKNSVHATETRI